MGRPRLQTLRGFSDKLKGSPDGAPIFYAKRRLLHGTPFHTKFHQRSAWASPTALTFLASSAQAAANSSSFFRAA